MTITPWKHEHKRGFFFLRFNRMVAVLTLLSVFVSQAIQVCIGRLQNGADIELSEESQYSYILFFLGFHSRFSRICYIQPDLPRLLWCRR